MTMTSAPWMVGQYTSPSNLHETAGYGHCSQGCTIDTSRWTPRRSHPTVHPCLQRSCRGWKMQHGNHAEPSSFCWFWAVAIWLFLKLPLSVGCSEHLGGSWDEPWWTAKFTYGGGFPKTIRPSIWWHQDRFRSDCPSCPGSHSTARCDRMNTCSDRTPVHYSWQQGTSPQTC